MISDKNLSDRHVVSHYRLISRIGSGAMGTVYKAQDLHLTRIVAIKFLNEQLTWDETQRRRFIREAQALSLLEHANICTVFDIEQTKDNKLFFAMPYYEGVTLAQINEEKHLDIWRIIDIVHQVAAGLAKAHQHRIVHRDIKPANIMITNTGLVKILDFGIAKLTDYVQMTQYGTALGTPAYMSPEQVQGHVVDFRTDIWSLGVVLHEAISKHPPFGRGVNPTTFNNILSKQALPIKIDNDPSLTTIVASIVDKALRKSRDERYQNMDEMACDLADLLKRNNQMTNQDLQLSIVDRAARIRSIAVLPLEEPQFCAEQHLNGKTVADKIATALVKQCSLRVIAPSSAAHLFSADSDRGHVTCAQQSGIDTLLLGSFEKEKEQMRISLQLINSKDAALLWADSLVRPLGELAKLIDDVAGQINSALLLAEFTQSDYPRAVSPNQLAKARDDFLKGKHFASKRTRDGLIKAKTYYKRALAQTPDYAEAYAELACVYTLLTIYGWSRPRKTFVVAEKMARKALSINKSVAEAHLALGNIQALGQWKWSSAENSFRTAISLDPTMVQARHWYAINVLMPTGHASAARQQLEQAHLIDPLSLPVLTTIGLLYYYERRYREALEIFREAVEIDKNFALTHLFIGMTKFALGHYSEGVESIHRNIRLVGPTPENVAWLGYAYARAGEQPLVAKQISYLDKLCKHKYVSFAYMALIHLGLGDSSRVLRYLQQAYKARTPDLVWLITRPPFDKLNDNKAFNELVDLVGLKIIHGERESRLQPCEKLSASV